MTDTLRANNSGCVTVVSWNYHHGNRHCVSETVHLLQRLGLLERLISNKYEIYDSNLKKTKPNPMYPVKLFYLILKIKNLISGNYKKTQFREFLFDFFASKNLGKQSLIYLDAERFPLVIKYANENGMQTLCYQRTAYTAYSISVLKEESKKRKYPTGYLDNGLNSRRVRCVDNTDFILAHSEFVKDTDVASGLNENKISVVYGCVDTDLYRPISKKNVEPVVFLFVGYDPVLKGMFYLLEAWVEIQDHINDAELWIVGKNQSDVFDLFDELKNVCSLGYQEDMVSIYQKASVLVQPSLVDAGPKAVTEAMASGLPVIVSNAIGYSEIVENDNNGYVVPARNHEILAEKIEYCVAHPAEVQRMGENARNSVKKLTHQFHAKQVVDAIKSIVKSGSLSR